MHFSKKLTVIFSTIAMASGLFVATATTETAKAANTQPVTIYLTRHGETTGNVMGRVQGWSDFPLTQNGLNVADNLGRGLKGVKFSSAYAGNLTRQEVTAAHVLKYSDNQNVTTNISEFLREGGYGSFEGDSIAADNAKIAAVYGYKSGDEFMAKTGKDYWNLLQDAYYKLDQQNSQKTGLAASDRAESAKMVQTRMAKELNTIAKTTEDNGGGNVLVVSSGMSINEYLSTMAPSYTGAALKNAAVTKLVYQNGLLSVDGPIGTLSYVEAGAKLAS